MHWFSLIGFVGNTFLLSLFYKIKHSYKSNIIVYNIVQLTEAVIVNKNSLSPLSKSKDFLRMRKAWWLLSNANLPSSFPATIAYCTSEFGVFGLSRSIARIPRNIVKPLWTTIIFPLKNEMIKLTNGRQFIDDKFIGSPLENRCMVVHVLHIHRNW